MTFPLPSLLPSLLSSFSCDSAHPHVSVQTPKPDVNNNRASLSASTLTLRALSLGRRLTRTCWKSRAVCARTRANAPSTGFTSSFVALMQSTSVSPRLLLVCSFVLFVSCFFLGGGANGWVGIRALAYAGRPGVCCCCCYCCCLEFGVCGCVCVCVRVRSLSSSPPLTHALFPCLLCFCGLTTSRAAA